MPLLLTLHRDTFSRLSSCCLTEKLSRKGLRIMHCCCQPVCCRPARSVGCCLLEKCKPRWCPWWLQMHPPFHVQVALPALNTIRGIRRHGWQANKCAQADQQSASVRPALVNPMVLLAWACQPPAARSPWPQCSSLPLDAVLMSPWPMCLLQISRTLQMGALPAPAGPADGLAR